MVIERVEYLKKERTYDLYNMDGSVMPVTSPYKDYGLAIAYTAYPLLKVLALIQGITCDKS